MDMPNELDIEQIIAVNEQDESSLETAMQTHFWNFAKFVTNQDGNDGRVNKDNYGAAAHAWDEKNDDVIEMLGYSAGAPSQATRAAIANALGLLTAPEVGSLLAQTNGNLLQTGQQLVSNALQTNQQNRGRYENQLLNSREGREAAEPKVIEKLEADSQLSLSGPAADFVAQIKRDDRFAPFARTYLRQEVDRKSLAENFKDYGIGYNA